MIKPEISFLLGDDREVSLADMNSKEVRALFDAGKHQAAADFGMTVEEFERFCEYDRASFRQRLAKEAAEDKTAATRKAARKRQKAARRAGRRR